MDHGTAPTLRAVHRPDSREHVGYLLTDACDPPCVIPCDRLGIPVGPAGSAMDGVELLMAGDRSGADEVFEALLPEPLTEDVDPRFAEADWIWRRVVIVEAGPALAVLRPQHPSPAELGRTIEVAIPADDLLHRASR
jgi:hypothetical protein